MKHKLLAFTPKKMILIMTVFIILFNTCNKEPLPDPENPNPNDTTHVVPKDTTKIDPKDTIKPKPETTYKIYLNITDYDPVEFVKLWNSIPDTGNYYLNLDSTRCVAIGMKKIDSVTVNIDWTKMEREYLVIERRNQLEAICGIVSNNRFLNGTKINPNINRRIGIVPTAGGPDTLFICLIPDCNDWMSKNYAKDGGIDRIEKDTNFCRELFFTAMDNFPVKDFYHNLYKSKNVWYQRDSL